MKLNWSYDKAVSVYQEILIFESQGYWQDGEVPEWAEAIGKHLQVATGSIHICFTAYGEIAKVFAKELGINSDIA